VPPRLRVTVARLKSWAKALVPEKYRLLRYEWYERLRYYPELFGSAVGSSVHSATGAFAA